MEDEGLLALSKPAGVLSHPSPGYWDGGTVAHSLVGRISEEMLCQRPGHGEKDSMIPRAIVHRLDKGTTGVMVVAKTLEAEKALSDVLRVGKKDSSSNMGRARKVYVALLTGCPNEHFSEFGGSPEGMSKIPQCLTVNASIGYDPSDPKRRAVVPDGQAATSVVHVHRHSPVGRGIALVTVELLTGRMHQIRVHCAHGGMPVVGDGVYGDRRSNVALRKSLGTTVLSKTSQRPLLHAWALDLPHPVDGKPLSLRAALPDDMSRVVAELWPDLALDPAVWSSDHHFRPHLKRKSKRSKDPCVDSSDSLAVHKEAVSSPKTRNKSKKPRAAGVKKSKRALRKTGGSKTTRNKKQKKKNKKIKKVRCVYTTV